MAHSALTRPLITAGLLAASSLPPAGLTALPAHAASLPAPGVPVHAVPVHAVPVHAEPVHAEPVHAEPVHAVRRGHDETITFRTRHAGEVLAGVTAAAPGVSWAVPGHESAVLSLFVDGRYASDDVVPSASPITREFALERLRAGRHTLRLRLAADRSAGRLVRVSGTAFRTVPAGGRSRCRRSTGRSSSTATTGPGRPSCPVPRRRR